MTDRAVFDFRAKEFASGTPYIHAACLSGPEILDGTLGFDLVKGNHFGSGEGNCSILEPTHSRDFQHTIPILAYSIRRLSGGRQLRPAPFTCRH